jgi:hypothetical protein
LVKARKPAPPAAAASFEVSRLVGTEWSDVIAGPLA